MTSALARQLRWLIGIRLLVITSVVVPYILLVLMGGAPAVNLPTPGGASPGTAPQESAQESAPIPDPAAGLSAHSVGFLYLLAVFTYLSSGFYYLLLRLLPRRYEAQAYLQFLGDLLLITALLWYFGVGVSNPFSLLYLLIIAVASTLLGRRAGFNIGIVAYCLYATLVLGLYYGWVPAASGSEPPTQSIFFLTYNLAVHLFAFVAVAFLTFLLVRRLERTQQALEEEREDLAELQVVHRDVVESLHSGLMTTDLEGTITSINRAGAEILGASPKDLLGRRTYETDLFEREHWDELTAHAGQSPRRRRRMEVEIQRENAVIYVGFSIAPLNDAEGRKRGEIVIFQDLTRWHQLEEEVRIKDRMAAVGELAAGLAHEIGNPLAAISGSVQMLSTSFDERQEEHKLLGILHKESQRLDRTIKGFLRFARPKDRSIVRFDVAGLLKENFELLRNSAEVAPSHRLQIDLDPPSVDLVADPDQISQIFWNLARNALRAMPGGGLLRVEGKQRKDHYRLEVLDTGTGMTAEERANLFHPFHSFFDTGTGIGMAIVYRIVEEHGGRLSVASRLGEGTKITVELPLAGLSAGREIAAAWRFEP